MYIKLLFSVLAAGLFLLTASCNCGDSQGGGTPPDSAFEKKIQLTGSEERIDISGIYAKGGHDNSYIMIIEKSGDAYIAEYAYLEGMLPPKDMLGEIKFELMNNFTVDTATMTFSSDKGNGTISRSEGNFSFTFSDKKDVLDEALVLEAYQF